MTTTFFDKIWNGILKSRGALTTAALSCVSLCFAANATPVCAQGDAAMRTIRPFIGYEETYQWSDATEVISDGVKTATGEKADPNAALDYAWATDLLYQKEIWLLQFAYKPVRSIEVDFPAKNGKMERKRVWYLVYSVTNTGKTMSSEIDPNVPADVTKSVLKRSGAAGQEGSTLTKETVSIPANNLDGVYRPKLNDYSADSKDSNAGVVRFAPRFVFASSTIQDPMVYERQASGFFEGKKRETEEGVYNDKYLPLAFAKIAQREARGSQTFYDSVRMATLEIKPGDTVWGIATWTDVDPRIDAFSIYVSGLTNALRWEDAAEEDADVDGDAADDAQFGARADVRRKVLKLNFRSPGDANRRGEQEIYNNLPGELDYQWIYL